MHSFPATSLLAVLVTSALTMAAPLHCARANNNDLAQFAVACSTVGVAGNLTFQAIGLLNKIQTDDQNVVGQLNAINATLNTAFNSGETARPVCEAPDPNNLATQFVTACSAINIAGSLTGTTIGLLNQIETDDQNVAGQVDVLKATMNGVNTAGQVANGVCEGVDAKNNSNNNDANGNNSANNNAKSSSSSSSTTSNATQSQISSAAKTRSE